jgi:hypothetical protein
MKRFNEFMLEMKPKFEATQYWEAERRDEILGDLTGFKREFDTILKRPYQCYPRIRSALHGAFPNKGAEILEAAKGIFRMSSAEFVEQAKKQREVLEERNSRQTYLSSEKIIAVVDTLKASTAIYDKVLLCMLACGARKIEVLDGGMSYFEGGAPGYIWQYGWAKSRKVDPSPSLCRPLLFLTQQEFLTVLGQVRLAFEAEVKSTSCKQTVVSRWSYYLETRSKVLWFENVKLKRRTGTHLCRAIYANWAFRLYGKGCSLSMYLKKTLGHETMGTAPHYMNIRINF